MSVTALMADADAAVAGIRDGATVLIGGFGTAGQPMELIDALRRTGAGELTVVNNNAGNGDRGLAALLAAGQVRKIICSFPRQSDSYVFDELYRAGQLELEVVDRIVDAGRLDPENVITPGIYIDRVVACPASTLPAQEGTAG